MDDHEMEDTLRPCGVAESALFDYLDVPEAVATRHAFARHMAECPDCLREVESYRSLYTRLSALRTYAPRTLELRPGFDARVMARVPQYGPLALSAATAGRRGWFERLIGTPERLRMGLGFAGFSFVGGAVLIAAAVTSLGGPQRAVAQGLSEAVRVGIGLLNTGVGQVVAAAHASDVLLGVSRLLKPLWNAAVTVSGACGPEFWLASTLVSVLALMGAVRLAAGSVEREVHHVSFCL